MQPIEQTLKIDPRIERRASSNMLLMLAGKFVSLFGSFIYSFAIGLYVLKVTGSGMSFATTLMLGILPRVLLGPIAGALADRLDRKTVVVVTDILSGAVVLGLFILSGIYGLQLMFIYVTTVLLAVLNTLFSVTLESAIPNLVDDSRLVRANSLNQSITSLTQIIAPIVGGAVYVLIDIRLFLIINGLSFVASGVTELFIDFNLNRVKSNGGVKNKLLADLAAGFVYLKGHGFLYALAWAAVFLNFFSSMGFNISLPYLANTVIGFNPTQYGIMMSLFPGGILVGSLLLSYLPEAKNKYKLIAYSLGGMSLGVILCGVPALPALIKLDLWLLFGFYIVVLFSTGLANPLINIPVFVIMQREVPDEYRGRVFGLIQTAAMAIMPLGLLLGGFLVEIWPGWSLPLLSGLGMLLILIIMSTNNSIRGL